MTLQIQKHSHLIQIKRKKKHQKLTNLFSVIEDQVFDSTLFQAR